MERIWNMKSVFALICLSAMVLTAPLGCVFAVGGNDHGVSKGLNARLDNLENRVAILEQCQAHCPMKAQMPGMPMPGMPGMPMPGMQGPAGAPGQMEMPNQTCPLTGQQPPCAAKPAK